MDQDKIIEDHYDAVALEYDGVNQLVDRLLSRLTDMPAGSAILDIGCGTGNLTLRLPEVVSCARVVGVDVSNGVLAIARRHAQDAQFDNFEFHRARASGLPLGNGEFDIVVSNIVFHLVLDKIGCLREILRVLKPSGRAFLQFIGGAPSAPEMMEIMQAAWREVLPTNAPVNLLHQCLVDDVLTVGKMEEYLSAVGIDAFEITWRRSVMQIREPDVSKGLKFMELVGGFWRHSLEKRAADQIWARLCDEVARRARSTGHFRHTVNHLLVEFAKPEMQ